MGEFLNSLCAHGLQRKPVLDIPIKSTKREEKVFEDYKNEILHTDPKSLFSTEELDIIDKTLDKDLCHRLGYEA